MGSTKSVPVPEEPEEYFEVSYFGNSIFRVFPKFSVIHDKLISISVRLSIEKSTREHGSVRVPMEFKSRAYLRNLADRYKRVSRLIEKKRTAGLGLDDSEIGILVCTYIAIMRYMNFPVPKNLEEHSGVIAVRNYVSVQ